MMSTPTTWNGRLLQKGVVGASVVFLYPVLWHIEDITQDISVHVAPPPPSH